MALPSFNFQWQQDSSGDLWFHSAVLMGDISAPSKVGYDNISACLTAPTNWSRPILIHGGLNKMDMFFQTAFSYDISWKKTAVFLLEFHSILFLEVQLTMSKHGDGLALNRHQVITWSNEDWVHWCKYITRPQYATLVVLMPEIWLLLSTLCNHL